MLNLNGFTGTEQYFIHPLFNTIKYTDGIKFIGDNKASWLITDILAVLSHEPKVKKGYEQEGFISIKINFIENKATATYTDGNEKILYTQKYKITDFLKHFEISEGKLNLYYTNGVLMLAREY